MFSLADYISKEEIAEFCRRNHIIKLALFGSALRDELKSESDIDIALISDAFTGDRFEDRRRIVPLRRRIDSRIEPIPFRPEDFNDGGMLVEEIKSTGKRIL